VTVLAYGVAAWLFVIGLVGIVRSRNLIGVVICVSVVQSSTYVLLLALGYQTGAKAPILADLKGGTPVVDPIVQALTLTDVVVEATVTAVLLALAVQAHKRFGTLDPDAMTSIRG
jgi:multicomponent Na+:H+ antiporter subunit C